jgi:hypothetical protein
VIADDADTLSAVLALSEGTIAEDAFASWMQAHLIPASTSDPTASEDENDEH